MDSSLTTSLSGMLANQQVLDVTAHNIANSDTNGFKASRTDFADQLYNLQITATRPAGSIGGRDPSQVGQGALVAAISTQWTQGGVNNTGRNLDVAITGTGFFRLQDSSGREHYSRVGNFGFDGGIPRTLVDLGTGMRVLNSQGQAISPVDTLAAAATTRLDLTGNLAPTAPLPLQGTSLSSLFPLRTTDGSTLNGSTPLSATTLANSQPTAAVTVNVFGTAPDGQPYNGQLTLAPTATVQDLVNGLNNALQRPTGTGTEQIATVAFDQGSLTATGAVSGSQFSLFLGEQAPPTLPASTAVANDWQYGAATDTYGWSRLRFTPGSVPVNMSLYTADGTAHEVTGRWYNASTVTTGTGAATDSQRVWDMVVDTPTGGTVSATGNGLRGLTFNANGSLLNAPTGSLASTWAVGGASTIAFTTTATGYQAAGVMDAGDQTGYAAGTLQDIAVDRQGILNGVYSNGKTVPMSATGSQIGLAVFVNNGGLQAVGDNLWDASLNSGAPTFVTGGQNGNNTISGGALESSNVDVANEFVRLVTAQRGFQANSRAFQTGDDLLTEAFGLFR